MTAVENMIAIDSHDAASGVITYWSLRGLKDGASHTALADAIEEAGLPREIAPSLPTPTTALYRAVQEIASRNRDVFVRKGRGALLLVKQHEDNTFSTEAEVQLDRLQRPTVDLPSSLSIFVGQEQELAAAVIGEYWHFMDTITTTDLSSWLTKRALASDAVRLRETGGVYFVPAHYSAVWQTLTAAVESVTTSRVYRIPAMKTDDAVEAVLDALSQECESFTQEIDASLASGDLGVRAMRGRADKADALMEKLQRYEGLLGDRMSKIIEGIETQKANVVMMAIAKEG